MAEDLLFDGLKVIDVGSWIAGPVSATILADFGADVIKVEEPEAGDGYRAFGVAPHNPPADVNYMWALDARNKRSLSLNLKNDTGLAILKRMIADCDVYVTNQPLPLRRELGLTYEEIAPLNERMIYASLTAYGEEGPERDREGFDVVAYWSRSGLMNKMRHGDAEPVQGTPGMGDHPSAISLYASIVTALLRRERTGRGGKVHTSLLANGLWSASCLAQGAFSGADLSVVQGQRLTTALYRALDGRWLQLSMIRNLEDLDRFLLCLDNIDLLVDERFSSLELRIANAAELTDLLRATIATRSSHEWMQRFRDADVPVALVQEFQDLPSDPQVLENSMAVPAAEDVGIDRVIRDPINVDGVARIGVKRAPGLGQHNSEVLAELGYSADEVLRLAEEGVI